MASTYFPNGGFYLSHSPEQSSTSPAIDAGWSAVDLTLAVYGMQTRTLQGAIDVGQVDMGFHYPNLLVGLP